MRQHKRLTRIEAVQIATTEALGHPRSSADRRVRGGGLLPVEAQYAHPASSNAARVLGRRSSTVALKLRIRETVSGGLSGS